MLLLLIFACVNVVTASSQLPTPLSKGKKQIGSCQPKVLNMFQDILSTITIFAQ